MILHCDEAKVFGNTDSVTLTTTIFGASDGLVASIAMILATMTHRRRVGLATGIACCRVMLGVHWLTDVLGGLALGWAWFALCPHCLRRLPIAIRRSGEDRRRDRKLPVMQRVRSLFEEFVRTDAIDLPTPGSGNTWRRFEALARWASIDLSVGRLSEGHVDAFAILAEADMKPFDATASYGVWAARSRQGGTSAERVPGGWQLTGRKEFCSGSGIIDRALVAADTDDGSRLFDIAIAENVVMVDHDSWPAVGMADSVSETLDFGGPIIREAQVVGPADFYIQRPGFWFGSSGVAACWYGGAVGLVNDLVKSLALEPNEHVLADLGVATSALEAMRAVLKETADIIDSDPTDAEDQARYRAQVTRQVAHDASMEVLARMGTAGGARPFCHDLDQARRSADLFVYLTQHHGGVDAAALGRLARDRFPWS